MHVLEYVGPVLAGLVFISIMSLVQEPARRTFNALFVGGASAAYLSGGGFGIWELPYVAIVGCAVCYAGLRSYRWIGVAWILHSVWDLAHHMYGNPIWPFSAQSSMGCAIMDPVLGIWFLAGAPSVFGRFRGGSARRAATGTGR
ncbi:MAG: DUF6010 family protein [Nannocystales bacterium]